MKYGFGSSTAKPHNLKKIVFKIPPFFATLAHGKRIFVNTQAVMTMGHWIPKRIAFRNLTYNLENLG